MTCGAVETQCVCAEPDDHDGPHHCECGGAWLTEHGKMIVVRYPGIVGELAGNDPFAALALLDFNDLMDNIT